MKPQLDGPTGIPPIMSKPKVLASLVLITIFAASEGFPILLHTARAAEPQPATQAEPGISWHTTKRWPTLGPIGFRLPEFPENTFLLLFPEWITSREKNWHVKPVWKTGPKGATATWKSESYALSLKIQFKQSEESRTLAWEYKFTNGSESALTDVATFNCFNLVDAPSFIDLKMKRTRISQQNRNPILLADVAKTISKRTIQFYPAKNGLKLPEFERFSRYEATSTQQLTGDRIGVTSRDGKWRVQSIVDDRVAYFFNNWEPDHGCIHAAPLLGNVAAGKTGAAKGRIVFTRLK